jgi:hypothetical protein
MLIKHKQYFVIYNFHIIQTINYKQCINKKIKNKVHNTHHKNI